jgi:DNA-binding NarL/FixJ family response regulator
VDLTDRERELVKLVATGMTNRQIADALQLPVREVDRVLVALFKKLRGEEE